VLDLFSKSGYDVFIRSKGKKMTVSELMAILRDHDPDAKVYVMNLISGMHVTPFVDVGDDPGCAVIIDCDE